MPDAHGRHGLPGPEGVLHAADAAGYVVAQTVVLACVHAQHKARMREREVRQLPQDTGELRDVVDLLADDVAARHIGVHGDGAQHLQVFRQRVVRRHVVAHDRERCAPERREKAQRHARLARDGRHHGVHLAQHARRVNLLAERRVGDLRVVDAVALIAARDPEELVLEKRVVPIIRVFGVFEHLPQRAGNVGVGDREIARQRDRTRARDALCEHIAIEIDLLQIREHRLPVLRHGEGVADLRDVIGRVRGVIQYEGGEIDKAVVVDLAVQVLAGEGGACKPGCRFGAVGLQLRALLIRYAQTEFFDVVQGIADLVADAERDQHVRFQICAHVRVEVGAEFAVFEDVGLDDGLRLAQTVAARLAHEHLGDGRNGGLELHGAVGKDVRDFRVSHAEDPESPVLAVDVAGDRAADDLQPVLVLAQRQGTQRRKIRDEISRAVVRRAQQTAQRLTVTEQLHHDILFFVQIELSEPLHGRTSVALFFIAYRSLRDLSTFGLVSVEKIR